MRKQGFTLVEILITLAIVAAIAIVAIPGFTVVKNRTAANQATAYLRTIHAAEKMYHAKYGSYAGDFGGASRAEQALAIQALLATDIKTKDYGFAVDLAADGQGYVAMAQKDGVPNNCSQPGTICINEKGQWTGSSSYKPKASVNG